MVLSLNLFIKDIHLNLLPVFELSWLKLEVFKKLITGISLKLIKQVLNCGYETVLPEMQNHYAACCYAVAKIKNSNLSKIIFIIPKDIYLLIA